MPTRVGDGHWWFFELVGFLLLSLFVHRLDFSFPAQVEHEESTDEMLVLHDKQRDLYLKIPREGGPSSFTMRNPKFELLLN